MTRQLRIDEQSPLPGAAVPRHYGGVARVRVPTSVAFTLIELLVVVAIIALLVSILLPAMGLARMRTRMTITHADLRQIGIAIQLYQQDNRDVLPIARCGCSFRMSWELPPELGKGYLPQFDDDGIRWIEFRDPFTYKNLYRYRAPGPQIMNEATYLPAGPQGASLYIPGEFPALLQDPGAYVLLPEESPVRYAIWSEGPDPNSPKLAKDPGRKPMLKRFWMLTPRDEGVITHIDTKKYGEIHSP